LRDAVSVFEMTRFFHRARAAMTVQTCLSGRGKLLSSLHLPRCATDAAYRIGQRLLAMTGDFLYRNGCLFLAQKLFDARFFMLKLYLWCVHRDLFNEMLGGVHYRYGQNGKPDEAWVYHDGHLDKMMRDRNHDGAWDEWAYYEHGRIVRSEWDNNFDGKPDETCTYSNGTLVAMEKDRDFNGTPDEYCTYTNGILDQVDVRPNGALFPTQRQLYRNGIVVEVLKDPDGSGGFRESVRYDPFFNPVSTNKLE
jgi:hypothetical protein